MKPKDIFNLAVRLLGLLFLYRGLAALPSSLPLFFYPVSFTNVVTGIIIAVWPLVVAWWLLRGARPTQDWAYPETKTGTAPIGEAGEPPGTPCVSCGKRTPAGARFCPSCGAAQTK